MILFTTYPDGIKTAYALQWAGTTVYTYSGLTATATAPTGTVSTTINPAGWVVEETTSTEYDRFGRVSKETYPGGYFITNQYDKYGYLTGIVDMNNANVWNAVPANARGQLTSISQGGTLLTGMIRAFLHDIYFTSGTNWMPNFLNTDFWIFLANAAISAPVAPP